MNRQFSLAGLLRLRQTQQDAAASGLARANSRTASLRRVLAARRSAQDLIDVGAYHRGSNPLVDAALDHEPAINGFLQQSMDESTPYSESWPELFRLSASLEGAA